MSVWNTDAIDRMGRIMLLWRRMTKRGHVCTCPEVLKFGQKSQRNLKIFYLALAPDSFSRGSFQTAAECQDLQP